MQNGFKRLLRDKAIHIGMGRLRPQDDIAGTSIHSGVQLPVKPGTERHRPGSIFYIDQVVKIYICRAGGTFQGSALFYQYLLGSQDDAVTGIDFSIYFNFFPISESKPCFLILTVLIPSSVILKVGKVILYIDVFFPQLVPIRSIRNENANPSCVDDARWTDCHSIRAYEIQVAVNFTVFNSIHRTVNINFAINQIDQIIGVNLPVLFIEMHVGYIAGADFIFTKPVQADVVIVQHRLYIQVLNVSSSYQVIPVFVRNRRRKTAHRLQQHTGQYQRGDPPDCGAGVGNRLLACSESRIHHARTPQRCGIYPRRQLADDTLCIIFATVLRDFGDHHVTLPGMAPDDLVDFVHDLIPVQKAIKENSEISDDIHATVWYKL